jgi:hypothetical protein
VLFLFFADSQWCPEFGTANLTDWSSNLRFRFSTIHSASGDHLTNRFALGRLLQSCISILLDNPATLSIAKGIDVMKYTLVAFTLFSASLISCQLAPTSVNNGLPAVEGTVRYFPPTVAIGGEADPSGFILTDYQWINRAPSFEYSRLYIKDGVDSSFLGMRVRISGAVDTLSAGGVETALRLFPLIRVRRLEVVR